MILFDFPLNPIDYIHRAGRTGRAGYKRCRCICFPKSESFSNRRRKGLVTSIVVKRDMVLCNAIQGAIARGLPIDSLSSAKRDYLDRGKHADVVGTHEYTFQIQAV